MINTGKIALTLFNIAAVCVVFAGTSSATTFQAVKHIMTIEDKEDPFRHPSDVAVSSRGDIYVLDGVNNRVVVFNRSGKKLFSFGRGGKGAGELNSPLGLSLDKKSNVYIADSGNHTIQIFSAAGKYLDYIDLPKDGTKLADPTDTVVDDEAGHMHVVDNDNHHVYTYDLKTKGLIRTTGGMGLTKILSDLRWPFTLELDKEGTLYIVDVINARVKVMPKEGISRPGIGGWGVGEGQLFRPKGVAVDGKGRVYVSDSYLGVIQIFDKEGSFISVIGGEEGKAKKFATPVRIFIDGKNRLYVVEMFANRVSVYKIK